MPVQQSRAWTAPLGSHGSGMDWEQRRTMELQLESAPPEEDASGIRALEAQGGHGWFCSPSSQPVLNTGGKASPAGAAPAPSRFAGSPGAHGTGRERTRGASGGAETPKARGLPQLLPPPHLPPCLRSFGSGEEATPQLHPKPGTAARDAPALPHPLDISACHGQGAHGMELSPLTGHHSSTRCALTCSHVGQSPMRLLEAPMSCWDAPHGNAAHPSGHCTEEIPATAQ